MEVTQHETKRDSNFYSFFLNWKSCEPSNYISLQQPLCCIAYLDLAAVLSNKKRKCRRPQERNGTWHPFPGPSHPQEN